jgi:acyl carrier protein
VLVEQWKSVAMKSDRPSGSSAVGVVEVLAESNQHDDTEQTLAKIWAQLLAVESPKADDTFFGLGGDSMDAVTMVTQVDDELGVDLPLELVFEDSTFSEIVIHVDRLRCSQAGGRPESAVAI